MKRLFSYLETCVWYLCCLLMVSVSYGQSFHLMEASDGLIQVYKDGIDTPVLSQQAKPDMRPYLHPVIAPDGKGVLTEVHPSHHLHQTGIYWGLKKVNGRDFFMNNGGDYYKKQAARIIKKEGSSVSWQTVYDLIDERGAGIIRETQKWQLQEREGVILLDLEWRGVGLKKVTMEQFFVGGLFIRMPWYAGIAGEAVNALGEKNMAQAEGHRAIWMDVGMEIEGRDEWGHIAILDHPDNVAFPSPWRVDNQLGVGPSRQILGNWSLSIGESATEKYRLVIYTGDLDNYKLRRLWKNYICETNQ